MSDVAQVADRIYLIDDRLLDLPRWGAVYLLDEEKKVLVDTGPGASAPTVIGGLEKLGIAPQDISYLVATHIHLDHSGGVGTLIRLMPKAQVLVHRKGARHLIDPSRLINSAIEARGPKLVASHGEIVPVDAERVRVVGEDDTIRLGQHQMLKFIDAPGHAPHELCVYETRGGGLFVGDAVAVYVRESDTLQPFHPPPHFDLQLLLETMDRVEAISPECLYYAHFGETKLVKEHLKQAREKLMVWDQMAREAAAAGQFHQLRQAYIDWGVADVEPLKDVPELAALHRYMVDQHVPLCADGHVGYYREILASSAPSRSSSGLIYPSLDRGRLHIA